MMQNMNGMGGAFMGDLDGFKEIIRDAVREVLDERDLGIDLEDIEDMELDIENKDNEIDELNYTVVELNNFIENLKEVIEEKNEQVLMLQEDNGYMTLELNQLKTSGDDDSDESESEDNIVEVADANVVSQTPEEDTLAKLKQEVEKLKQLIDAEMK